MWLDGQGFPLKDLDDISGYKVYALIDEGFLWDAIRRAVVIRYVFRLMWMFSGSS